MQTPINSKSTSSTTQPKVWFRAVKLAIAGLALAGATLGLGATPASATTRLGGVDMQRACNTQQGQGFRAVVTDQSNAYSWRCRFDTGYLVGIDVNRACANQYGSGASAGLDNPRNPYTWYCKR